MTVNSENVGTYLNGNKWTKLNKYNRKRIKRNDDKANDQKIYFPKTGENARLL